MPFFVIVLIGCILDYSSRRFDDTIGQGNFDGVEIKISQGTYEIIDDTIVSNVQSPSINLQLTNTLDQPKSISIKLYNMRPDSLPKLVPEIGMVRLGNEKKLIHYDVTLEANQEIEVQILNYDKNSNYRFAAVGDIQYNKKAARKLLNHIAEFGDSIDFLIILGDLVNTGDDEEYDWAYEWVKSVPLPVYVIYGNHDAGLLTDGYPSFKRYFGKTTYHFEHGDDLFLILDAADQGVSRDVFDYAKTNLQSSQNRRKFVFSHVPVFDESGIRNNSFNTSYDAARFMNMLIDNDVDILFSGHVHTYQDFTISGVRNITAGMGGGIPERLDEIGDGYIIVESDLQGINVERIELGD